MFADVLPDPGRPLDALFTYSVPDSLRPRIGEGIQVLVPFGKQTVPGFVVRLHDQPPADRPSLKEILDVPEGALCIHQTALPLARWMSDHYLCSLGQALRAALPPEATFRLKRTVRLGEQDTVERARAGRPSVAPLLDALAGRELSIPGLKRRCKLPNFDAALAWLRMRGAVIVRSAVVTPAAKRQRRYAVEAAAPAEVLLREAQLRRKRAPAQAKALRAIARRRTPASAANLCKRLNLRPASLRSLASQGLVRIREAEAPPMPAAGRRPAKIPRTLTLHQGAALREIVTAMDGKRSPMFLLLGVAASGKTEVCLRAIQHVLEKGQQAIVLMPEISLTGKVLASFEQRFPGRLAVLHSGLSSGERYAQWRRVQSGEAAVVIGARSAVFAPCPRLGLIIVDDEHDPCYKQENVPLYHARDVAVQRARIEGAAVILASATPSLESFYAAEQGKYHLLHLPTRADARPLPQVTCVDLRGMGGRLFSPKLVMGMKHALDAGQQVVLFLNRRGFSRMLLCPACGQTARCPSCEVALAYHLPARRLVCHHCGLEQPAPDACANCGSPHLTFRGHGTERLEQEIRRVCPGAAVARLDSDAAGQRQDYRRIVSDFRRARTRVLIGTQMISSALDSARTSLVGIMAADTSLNLPDFRAAERTFQILTQLTGRCAQTARPVRVVLQTYQPDHYAIRAALNHDYMAFYAREMEARREHGFPPFCVMAALTASSPDAAKARSYAFSLAQRLAERGPAIRILGPAPAPMTRIKGKHRWQVLLRAPDYEGLLAPLREALSALRRPRDVSATVDVDPVTVL